MSGQKQKREQILIMNNSAAQRKALSNMLSDKYDIIEAESGDGVLQLLKERSYDIDLVLLEINETGTDEFKLLSLIKNYRWIDDTPVVMISPEVSHEYIQKAYDDGVVDYIRRPYDSFEVHKRLANILLLYRKQKRLLGALEEQVYDNEKNNRMMINVLAHIVEFRNGESGMHVHHIRTLTAILIQRLVEKTDKYHLTENDMLLISTASSFHDIGKISIDDKILNKPGRLTAEEFEIMKSHSVIGADMLTELYKKKNYPLIDKAYEICRWHHERYDGKGYPDGLKGQEIPEISRIIAAADTYDNMTSKKRNRDALSYQVVREEFIKMSGGKLDPEFSEMVVRFMDEDHTETETEDITQLETELRCGEYRDNVSMGIPVLQEITKIHFECDSTLTDKKGFSAPSVIFFDSYNRHIHRDPKTITAYRYVEFGEIWFDGHYVSTNARNIEVKVTDNDVTDGYEITAGRYDDHLSVKMISPKKTVESIIALPDNSKTSYIGLTGENCLLKNITADKTGIMVSEGDIRKIVGRLSYIDRIESDMPNIQIDHNRSASTE